MIKSIKIASDDFAWFCHDLERVFLIKLKQNEPSNWYTLGDVYETLCTHFNDQERRDGACMDALAFYRIRRALSDQPKTSLMPKTPIHTVYTTSAVEFLGILSKKTDLHVPEKKISWIGLAGTFLIIIGMFAWIPIGLFAIPPSWRSISPLICATALGILLIRSDPGSLPAECRTLGDLSRMVARINYGRLRRIGARIRPGDVWSRLVGIAIENSGLSVDPKAEELSRDTRLI